MAVMALIWFDILRLHIRQLFRQLCLVISHLVAHIQLYGWSRAVQVGYGLSHGAASYANDRTLHLAGVRAFCNSARQGIMF